MKKGGILNTIIVILFTFNQVNVQAAEIEQPNSLEPTIDYMHIVDVTETSAIIEAKYTMDNGVETNDSDNSSSIYNANGIYIDMDHNGDYETLLTQFPDTNANESTTITLNTSDVVELEPNTIYDVQASVCDQLGQCTFTNSEFKTQSISTPVVSYIGDTFATIVVDYNLGYSNPDQNIEATENSYFEISEDGGQTWSNIGGTFVNDETSTTGDGIGTLILPEDSLTQNTTYTVRAHVENDLGTVLVSEEVSFTTKSLKLTVENITSTSAELHVTYNLQKDSTTQVNPSTIDKYDSHFEGWGINTPGIDRGISFEAPEMDSVSETEAVYTIYGLAPGTTYQVMAIVTTNEQDVRLNTGLVEFTTPGKPTTPVDSNSPATPTDSPTTITTPVNNNTLEETGNEPLIIELVIVIIIFGLTMYIRFKK